MMLRHYSRFIGQNIRKCQINHSIEQTQLITQFSRQSSSGKIFYIFILCKLAQIGEDSADLMVFVL